MSETLPDIPRPTPEGASSRDGEGLPIIGAPGVRRKRIVIVGAGFAGIAAARALKRCDAEVVVIDRRNHHIFQPLLYQVATAVLAPSHEHVCKALFERARADAATPVAGAVTSMCRSTSGAHDSSTLT